MVNQLELVRIDVEGRDRAALRAEIFRESARTVLPTRGLDEVTMKTGVGSGIAALTPAARRLFAAAPAPPCRSA